MQPTSPPIWQPEQPRVLRTRGFLLSSFIALGALGNIAMCIGLLFMGAATSGLAKERDDMLNPGASAEMKHLSVIFHFMALIALVNVVFLTGAWMWKKWGVYGYGGFVLFGGLIGAQAASAMSAGSVMWGLIVVGIVASKWKDFE
jgi:hypothetical protein